MDVNKNIKYKTKDFTKLIEILNEEDRWTKRDEEEEYWRNKWLHDLHKPFEQITEDFSIKFNPIRKYKVGQTVATVFSSKIHNPVFCNQLCVVKEIIDSKKYPYSVVFCDPEIEKLQTPNMTWGEELLVRIEDVPIELSSEEMEDILNG